VHFVRLKRFAAPDPEDHGTQLLRLTTSGPVNHRVEMWGMDAFFLSYIGQTGGEELEPADWLVIPQQKLRTIVEGRVFRDDIGLEARRRKFTWYPHDVWLYMMAAGWYRIGQEEHLMGRAGHVGDEVGSALIALRLVRDIMRLALNEAPRLVGARSSAFWLWDADQGAPMMLETTEGYDTAPSLQPYLLQLFRQASECAFSIDAGESDEHWPALLAGRAVLVLIVILLYSDQFRRMLNRLFERKGARHDPTH
jgi:hypothetical protein